MKFGLAPTTLQINMSASHFAERYWIAKGRWAFSLWSMRRTQRLKAGAFQCGDRAPV